MKKFKIGDTVQCIDISYSQALTFNEIYTVYSIQDGLLGVEDVDGKKFYYASRMFKQTNKNSTYKKN